MPNDPLSVNLTDLFVSGRRLVNDMSETGELKLGDQSYQLPIVTGSEGEKAIDIRKLRSDSGYITLDSGYGNTGACSSAITFIDGETGSSAIVGSPLNSWRKNPVLSRSPTC